MLLQYLLCVGFSPFLPVQVYCFYFKLLVSLSQPLAVRRGGEENMFEFEELDNTIHCVNTIYPSTPLIPLFPLLPSLSIYPSIPPPRNPLVSLGHKNPLFVFIYQIVLRFEYRGETGTTVLVKRVRRNGWRVIGEMVGE